ncbi:hypothetical protein WJX77_001668 [Trebouxia sp. C0004]
MVTEEPKPEASTSQAKAVSTENQAQPPAKVPKELRAWQAWFTALCIPVFLAMFTCSMLGLYVLTDEDSSTWLGQSWFGHQWRRLINYNQFFSAATLNGGLLGSLIASFRLKEHRSAQRNRMFRSQFSNIYNQSEIAKDKKSSKRQLEPKKRK